MDSQLKWKETSFFKLFYLEWSILFNPYFNPYFNPSLDKYYGKCCYSVYTRPPVFSSFCTVLCRFLTECKGKEVTADNSVPRGQKDRKTHLPTLINSEVAAKYACSISWWGIVTITSLDSNSSRTTEVEELLRLLLTVIGSPGTFDHMWVLGVLGGGGGGGRYTQQTPPPTSPPQHPFASCHPPK